MASQDLTQQQILDLAGTHHVATGVEFPQPGLQPYYQWLMQTIHRLAERSAGDLLVGLDDSSSTSVWISSGRASIAGVSLQFTGQSLDLGSLNNDTVAVWLEDSAGPQIEYESTAIGWPASDHIKLAEVTVTAGAIANITDLRFETILKA